MDLERNRGNTFADNFTIKKNDELLPLANHTFVLSINPEKEPEDNSNDLYSINGVITSYQDSTVEFVPTPAQADQTPARYFYSLLMTDDVGRVKTIAKGAYTYLGFDALSIVVEDGSLVADANSYVTRSDLINYAAARDIELDDRQAEQALLAASDYINSLEQKLQGKRTSRDQAIAFPRTNLFIDGWHWESDEIPRQLILAQLELALEVSAGIDLYNREAVQVVKKERIEGAITVEYAAEDSQKISKQSTASAIIRSLMRNAGLYSAPIRRY